MPKFSYKAKQGPTKIVSGTIDADNPSVAVKKILELGLSPVDVTQHETKPAEKPAALSKQPAFAFPKRVPQGILVLFTRQLCDLVEASVPILKGLQLVEKQTKHAYFKTIINSMIATVKDGGSLSDALGRFPAVFSKLYINMVKAGETSGQLSFVLTRLANLMEHDQEMQLRVRASLAYPLFILAVGILSVFVLLTFIIPRLMVVFEDFNQELPLPTLLLVNTSSFLAGYWWLVIGIGVFIYIYGKRLFVTSKGRVWWATTQLRMPVIGNFIKEVEIGRFARTMGTLVESGVVIIDALNSVKPLFENEILRQEMEKVIEDVANGSSLAVAVTKQCPHFSETAVNMIAVGEETGHLEKGLYKLADSLERQADATAKIMVSLVGPAFLVLVVGFIGMIVVAMLLPIFKMNLIVQ